MQDLSIYFSPITITGDFTEKLGDVLERNDSHGFPTLEEKGVALISVPEYRNGLLSNPDGSTDFFRSKLYSLYKGDSWNFKLYDLGQINPGNTVDDTYFALSQVVAELVKASIVPVIIGGSQDLTLACYKGYEKLEQTINVCAIDHALDIGNPETGVKHNGYVSHLLMQRPCYLFNFATIGAQRPLIPKTEMELFENLYFDICRLGEFNADFKRAEPHLRNSDLILLDVESVKGAEIDPVHYHQPNGFRADQICQITKYAGISDKLTCLGIFNIHPDQNLNACALIAQMVWYFLDGFAQRFGDFPLGSKKNYTKFFVHMDHFEDDLVFYKSNKSGRWWLEVSYPSGEGGKYERHHMVPCSYEDYQLAMEDRVPDLWWRTLQKLT